MDLPAVALADFQPGLSRSLASSCSSVVVTNVGLSTSSIPSSSSTSSVTTSSQTNQSMLDLGGTYEESRDVLSGRKVYEEIEQENVLYWTTGLEAPANSTSDGALRGNGNVGALAACDRGAWMIRAMDGTFPTFLVFDCASHPADVTAQDWYAISCRDCVAEPVDGAFTMECSPESTDDEVYDADDSVFFYTPSPTPPPFTNSPAVRIREEESTVAPGATFEVVLDESESTCDTVYVINADTDGEYSAGNFSTDGRYVYTHSSGDTLQWISYYRRRLSSRETLAGVETRSDLLTQQPRPYALAAGSPVGGRTSRGEDLPSPETSRRRLGGASRGAAVSGAKDAAQSLELCYDGRWLFMGPSGEYPHILAYDCATHPADVTSTWYDQEDYSSYTYARENQVFIVCSGETDSSSSPGARRAVPWGDNDDATAVDADAGEDSEDSEDSGASDLLGGLLVSGGLLVGLGLCACCVTAFFFHRGASKRWRVQAAKQQHEQERVAVVHSAGPTSSALRDVQRHRSGGGVTTGRTRAPYAVSGGAGNGDGTEFSYASVTTRAGPATAPTGIAAVTGTASAAVAEEKTTSVRSQVASAPVAVFNATDVFTDEDEAHERSGSEEATAAETRSVRSIGGNAEDVHPDEEKISSNKDTGIVSPGHPKEASLGRTEDASSDPGGDILGGKEDQTVAGANVDSHNGADARSGVSVRHGDAVDDPQEEV